MEQVSVSTFGGQPKPGSCFGTTTPIDGTHVNAFTGTLNSDGRQVTFYSQSQGLVARDTNNSCDYFVRDRGPRVGTGGFVGGTVPGPDEDEPICVTEDLCLPAVALADSAGEVRAVGADRVQRVAGADYDVKGGSSFGLFRQDATEVVTKVATLKGGYGTTGHSVVVAVPLKALGMAAGARLGNVQAFTGVGSFVTGPTRLLDTIRLSG